MRLCCVGLNHRRAPVELRERVAFSADELERALEELRALEGIEEAAILSTCNRVEIYAAGDADSTPYQIGHFLQRFHAIDDGDLEEHLFRMVGEDAVSHLFRVAASLDAIVVGEPQILGQVKEAYFRAAGSKTAGPTLNRAFHRAFTVAKRVRTETAIAKSAVSVSYAGVELARKIFGDLSGLDCLLVGAGDMGELAARHFVERGARLMVANRSYDRAHRLAETYGGVARELSELERLMAEVDIVLCSTSAPGFVITKDMAKRAAKARRYRPLFLIDIAVPRDVDPAVAKAEGVFCYDVDDLTQVVEENLEQRAKEAERAEDIVRSEVIAFAKKNRELKAVPTIKALREKCLEIARAETEKTLAVLGDDVSKKQKKSVEAMGSAVVNKILHQAITILKQQSARPGEGDDLLQLVRDLFDLDIPDEDSVADTAAVLAEASAAEAAFDQDELEARFEAEEVAA